MTYRELEELKKQGKLILCCDQVGMRTRRKYINSKTKGEYIAGIFVPDIERVETIKYMKFFYGARTQDMPEHSSYKITKKDYLKLLKLS